MALRLNMRFSADGGSAKAELAKLREEMNRLHLGAEKVDKSALGAGRSVETAGRRAQQASRGFDRAERSARGAGSALRTFGSFLTGAALVEGGRRILSIGTDMRATNAMFRAAAGDARSGAEELAFATGIADKYGLALRNTQRDYGKLLAATRGTTLRNQSQDIFESIAATAGALQLSTDETQGALRAVEQIISKGKVQAEELRGQLGERIPGAFQIAARAMGTTTAELSKMLENGEVLSEDFIPKFARQLREEFGASAVDAAQEVGAEFRRMTSAVRESAIEIAEGGVLDVAADGLRDFTSFLKDPATLEAMSDLGAGAGFVGSNLGELATIALLVAGGRGLGALTASMGRASLARRELASAAQSEFASMRQTATAAASEARVRQVELAALVRQRASIDQVTAARQRLSQAHVAQAAASNAALQAQTRMIVSQNALTVASRAGAVAMGGLRGAMAFLGGPIGVAITGLGIAFTLLSSRADETANSIRAIGGEVRSAEGDLRRLREVNLDIASDTAHLTELNDDLKVAIETQATVAEDTARIEIAQVNDRIRANERLKRTYEQQLAQQSIILRADIKIAERSLAGDAKEAAFRGFTKRSAPRLNELGVSSTVDPRLGELFKTEIGSRDPLDYLLEVQGELVEEELAVVKRAGSLLDSRVRLDAVTEALAELNKPIPETDGGASGGGGGTSGTGKDKSSTDKVQKLIDSLRDQINTEVQLRDARKLSGDELREHMITLEAHQNLTRVGLTLADAEGGANEINARRIVSLTASLVDLNAAKDAANEVDAAFKDEFGDSLATQTGELESWRDATIAALHNVGGAYDALKGKVEDVFRVRLKAAYDRDLENRTDWRAGVERGLNDITDEHADYADAAETLTKRGFDKVEDIFVEFASKGKISVSSFTSFVVAEFARMAFRSAFSMSQIGGAGGGGGGLIASLVSGISSVFTGGATTPTPSGGRGLVVGPVAQVHGGGLVRDAAPSRMVDMSIFNTAKRLHAGGMVAGETPAILLDDERVLTAAQQSATAQTISGLAAMAGTVLKPVNQQNQTPPVTVNIIGAGKGEEEPTVSARNGEDGLNVDVIFEDVEGFLSKRLAQGEGALGTAMERRFAVTPRGAL